MFVGKMPKTDLAKLNSDKIFALLLAMEWNPYDLPNPESLIKENKSDILKWVGLAPDKLKEIYQEEIRKRIPKQKPEEKKSAEKKQAKAKTPAAKKTKTAKKTTRKKLPEGNGKKGRA
jgi:septum formation inhibitor MinC